MVRPVTNLSALELLEHSVLGEDLDRRPLEGISGQETPGGAVHSGTVRAFGSSGNPGR